MVKINKAIVLSNLGIDFLVFIHEKYGKCTVHTCFIVFIHVGYRSTTLVPLVEAFASQYELAFFCIYKLILLNSVTKKMTGLQLVS